MRWMWIDRVIELQPGVRAIAVKNVSLAEEHLHDHFAADPAHDLAAQPVMPASLIIEGLAQTGGILFGHSLGFSTNIILAKITRAEFVADVLPGSTLRYTATIDRSDAAGASVRGVAELMDHAKPDPVYSPLATIDLLFSTLDPASSLAADRQAPAHNFVFGESFKTLLRTSGVSFPN